MYSKHSVTFFSIDNRGRGVITDFRQGEGTKQGGSCFELIEESVHDIAGAIEYLKNLGKTKIILQGHSLGCIKVVNYLLEKGQSDIQAAILIAPTDMVKWGEADANHHDYLARAYKMIEEGKGDELVEERVWSQKTPISAKTYVSICAPGTAADMYGDREGGALLGRVEIPMLLVYGDADTGIQKTYSSIENWVKRAEEIKNKNTEIKIVEGAQHGFRGHEAELTHQVWAFVHNLKV
jgi:alpha-beta hydrolase superfamily lysophospholipase